MGVILGEELENGVQINGTIDNSGAANAGLKNGDIITAIDGQKVQTIEEMKAILKDKKIGDIVAVTYLRDDEEMMADITLGSKKVTIKKPKDIDIFLNDKKAEAEMETYEEAETPKVAEGKRLEIMQLDMYPNPNQGAFTLDFEIEPGATIIIIKNVADEEVYKKEMPDFNGIFSDRIDISQEPSGVYFLTIQQGEKINY
ncbi:MAG: PDZ domain-containing protein [Saprospiraceae bacterium]|nr:PDZ domain-containing protein [Saprospiraceae bacterium]